LMLPAEWRWLVALLALTVADGARQAAGSDFEIWPLSLTALAWVLRRRRWASGLALGMACAMKQTAWFAAPFFFIWAWRTYGPGDALKRLGISVATFLLINLPWLVQSPGAWAASLLLPVSLPLLPDGSGIIALSLTGVLPLFPSWVYAAMEVLALVVAWWWYARHAQKAPYVGLLLPLVPMLFAWRSPERYFVLLPLLGLLAVALRMRYGDSSADAGVDIATR